MQLRIWLVITLALTTAACNKTAQSVVQDAEKAMGSVTSIQYAGTGVNGNYGQALLAGKEWPRRDLTGYTRKINYTQRSNSEEIVFAQPQFGGQRQNPIVSGDKAWNGADTGPVPQPAAAEGRQLRIWMTPHGFLKAAAQAGNATLTEGSGGASVVTFTALGKYQVTGTIDGQNMVTEVDTKVADPLLGDTPLTVAYSGYKDYGGVKFPTKIVESQGGFPILDLNVTSVQPNAAVDFPVPDAVAKAGVPSVVVQTTKLADGVWYLTGGTHHSLVVEFPDFITVIEGPLNEERSLAVIAEAKKLVPNKPIRYVVNTHHHFDHSGGLRTFVAEGATVVTHASNKDYYEQAFKAPATIAPDTQAKSPKTPNIQTVTDKYAITGGKQTIEVYATQKDTHTDELLVAYLPGPGILVEADSYSPGPPNTPPPSPAPPNAVSLWENIQRLKLNVRTIAPIHGRGAVPFAEFRKFVGK
ncbi:MAG TPA: MBL fold metallo-hydrolase [Bryobacteraceae bacterium]|nr:MBL fold metallo-hydrolase [Bryobacteraceae bacterium]